MPESALEQSVAQNFTGEELPRAKWTQASREAYHKESPGNFAGPDLSFPIRDGNDVKDAWNLAGHAANPSAVRAKIKAIAKRLGLEGSLPDTAKEDGDGDGKERAVEGVLIRADGSHDPFSGSHSHAHPAFGHGDDDNHSHDHSHDNDADHKHSHDDMSADRAIDASQPLNALVGDPLRLSFPVVRVDQDKRMVYGRATVEEPDRHGTIFSYEGAKAAFKRWKGNIREQHDPKKAVGRSVSYECNDDEKGIYLLARVSKGAPDTWEKVLDNTLNDFSVSVLPHPRYGPDPSKWPKREFNGRQYPYLDEYDYAEISLVDAGSAPGTTFTIVRADGAPTELVAVDEPEQPLERAGARISNSTKSQMHDAIAGTLKGAMAMMGTCGCDACGKAMKAIDPDNDGDIDLGGFDDPDNDADSLYNKSDDGDMERKITGMVERALQPVYSRLQAIAGTLARSSGPAAPDITPLTRAVEGLETRLADLPTAVSLAEVRAEVSAVKERVTQIAEQPMPGGPVHNASAIPQPQPIDKRLPTDPYRMPQTSGSSVYDAVAALSATGQLDTVQKQVDAMAAALAAQRRR